MKFTINEIINEVFCIEIGRIQEDLIQWARLNCQKKYPQESFS